MSAETDAEALRSGYEAFAKGDMDAVAKLFSPDIRWNIGGKSEISGTYEGHEAVFAFFGRLMELTEGTFQVEIHDLLASDDHVVVLVRESATRGDKHLDSNEVHVWHLDDGIATEYWGIPQDQYKVDAFFQ